MIRYCFILIFLFLSVLSEAQNYKENESFKLGISGGYNFTTVRGTELEKPLLKSGFTIGMFYRHQLSPKLHSLVEARTTFRGSRFEAELDEEYERLDLVYLDFPLQLMVDVKKDDEHLIFFGPQISTLVNSRMFIHQYIKGPSSQATYLHDDLDLKVLDVAAVLGYQHNGYYTGFHAAFKFGLLNINDGFYLEKVIQETGKNGTIYNLAFEMIFMF